ncbi:MAG TPA: lipopolysaccharide biosynthesis protein [Coriobacteriia bacterium]
MSTSPVELRDTPAEAGAAASASDQGLTHRTTTGVGWTLLGLAIAEPIRITVTALLARALTPQEFGIVGMATVFLGLAAIGNDLGLPVAIIQRRETTQNELSSLFWFNLSVGVAFAVLGVLASQPLAAFFHQPAVAPVLAALSVGFIVTSLVQIQGALVRRRMDFRTPAIANIVGVAIGGIVAIAAARAGWGVWALVINSIVSGVVLAGIVAATVRWVPTRRFRWREVRPFVLFGGALTVAGFAGYGAANVDNLVVGRVLGAGPLGIYALAYNLIMYPVRRIASTVTGVTLPAFSRIQGDNARYAAAFVRALEMSASVVTPLLMAAAVASESIVLGLYGPKWAAAVIPFRLLCVAGLGRGLGVLAEVALKGLGKGARLLWWTAAGLLGVAAGAWFGIPSGVNGVAVGVSVATMFCSALMLWDVMHLLGVTLAVGFVRVGRPMVLGAAAAGSAWLVGEMLGLLGAGHLVSAVLAVALGVVIPLAVAFLVPGFAGVRELVSIIRGRMTAASGDTDLAAEGPSRG